MIDSILNSTKKHLGVPADYDAFDEEIIMFINSGFFTLAQAGIGPEGFMIEDDIPTWEEYLPDIKRFLPIKQFIWLFVRVNWDPPQNSTLLENMNKKMEECLWRLNVHSEISPARTFSES